MLILVSINLEIISIYAPGQFVVGMKTFVLYDLEGRGLRGEPQLHRLYTNSRGDAQMHQSTWYDSQKHQEFLATGCRGYKLWNRQAEVAMFYPKEPLVQDYNRDQALTPTYGQGGIVNRDGKVNVSSLIFAPHGTLPHRSVRSEYSSVGLGDLCSAATTFR